MEPRRTLQMYKFLMAVHFSFLELTVRGGKQSPEAGVSYNERRVKWCGPGKLLDDLVPELGLESPLRTFWREKERRRLHSDWRKGQCDGRKR